MRREPDNLETMDDSESYEMRGQGRIVYVEGPKRPDWLVLVATGILAGGIAAAWTANARLATVEAQGVYMRDEIGNLRTEVAELKRIIESRYHDPAR